MKSKRESDIEREAINFTSIQNVDFNILYKVLNHPMCRLPLKNIFIDQVIKMLEEKAENRAIIERVIIEKAREGEKLALNSRNPKSNIDYEANIDNSDMQNKDRVEAEKEAAKISKQLDKLLDYAQEKINEHDIATKAIVDPEKNIEEIKSEIEKKKKIIKDNEQKIEKSTTNEKKAQEAAQEAEKKEAEARAREEAQSKLEKKALENSKQELPKFQIKQYEKEAEDAKAAKEKENQEAEKQKNIVDQNKKKIEEEAKNSQKAKEELDKAKSAIEDFENKLENEKEALKKAKENKEQAEKNEQEARMQVQKACSEALETVKNEFAKKYIPILSYIDFSAASLDQLRSLSKFDEDGIYDDLNHFLKARESELNYNQKNLYIRNQQKKIISNSLKYQHENDDFINYIRIKKETIEQNKIKLLALQDELKCKEKELVKKQNENIGLKQKAHVSNVSDPNKALNDLSNELGNEVREIEAEINKYQKRKENQNEDLITIAQIVQIKEEYKNVHLEYLKLHERSKKALQARDELINEINIFSYLLKKK